MCWEGELIAATETNAGPAAALRVETYGPIDGAGFGISLQVHEAAGRSSGRLLSLVSDRIMQHYPGTCLVEQTIFSNEDWVK